MLGDKDVLGVPFMDKTSFLGEFEETKIVEIMEHKDKEIKSLKKTIKKLQKEIQFKNQLICIPQTSQGKNLYFKRVIQREVSRYNELKKLISSITVRVKKLTSDIDQQVSVCHNSQTMQNIVMMLDGLQMSRDSSAMVEEDLNKIGGVYEVDGFLDQLEIAMRNLIQNYGETSKNYKQLMKTQKQQLQDVAHYKEALKKEKKTKDLLQNLLEKNETEKNQLVNQINLCINQQELQNLKKKSKEDIILYACQLNYRIKDLQQQKQQYTKEIGREMQKEMQLYQKLAAQVKTFKEQARMRQSMA